MSHNFIPFAIACFILATSLILTSMTGIGAAWKVADIEEGCTIAIFGLGAVGLAVLL